MSSGIIARRSMIVRVRRAPSTGPQELDHSMVPADPPGLARLLQYHLVAQRTREPHAAQLCRVAPTAGDALSLSGTTFGGQVRAPSLPTVTFPMRSCAGKMIGVQPEKMAGGAMA